MEHSEKVNEIGTALANAQPNITGALKDGSNPHYGSSFATLQSCIEASRGALSANGLSVIQGAETDLESGNVQVTTMLLHKSGQWIRSTLSMTPEAKKMASNPAQAYGSCLSYARRYGYTAMIGLYQIDDDGEGGTAPEKGKQVVTTSGIAKPTATPKPSTTPKVPANLAKSKEVRAWMEKFKARFPAHTPQLMQLLKPGISVKDFKAAVTHLAGELQEEDHEQPTPPVK